MAREGAVDEARLETVQVAVQGRLKRQPGRGMYILPSLFTAGNIAAGYYAIVQAIQGLVAQGTGGLAADHFDRSALAIGFAIVFDSFDGMIARMTNTASDFGRELDSLADVITFGVAPSLLAFIWGFHSLPETMNPDLRHHVMQAGAFLCFLYVIGGASRLARFNISHDPKPR